MIEGTYLSADLVVGEEAHQSVAGDVEESVRRDDLAEVLGEEGVQSCL